MYTDEELGDVDWDYITARQKRIAGSLGIAFSWQNYTRPEDMRSDADQAMYRAKAKGKAGYEIVYGHAIGSSRKPQNLDWPMAFQLI